MVDNKKDWEEVVVDDSVWRPEKLDDELIGVYMAREINIGPYNSKRYTIKNDDGEIFVYGSTALDQRMAEISTGDMIKIVYKGEKPSVPPKKPFKMFKVFKRKKTSEPEEPENESPTLAKGEDVDAKGWIDEITEELLQENATIDNEGNAIRERAKLWHLNKDMGMDKEMLVRIDEEIKRKG